VYQATLNPVTDGSRPQQRGRIQIAYLTLDDPKDRRAWSGTQYHMARALQEHCGDVVSLGPLYPRSLNVGKVIQKLAKILLGKRYLYIYTPYFSKAVAHMAESRLSKHRCDVIVAPAGSAILGHLRTEVPIVYLSDTTFRLIEGYYADFSDVLPSHKKLADNLEQASISKAAHLVYPSSWAAASAIADYRADPRKVSVVPLGANIEKTPTQGESIENRSATECRLLFVGVDWHRKGGAIAFEALKALKQAGISSSLSIVGCTPPAGVADPDLKVFKSLNMNNEIERRQLEELYRDATFFVLPTRAECYGIAFCEANAYGIPVISTDTGGVSEIVKHGVNGFLLPPEAGGDQYAQVIASIFRDTGRYKKLRLDSRQVYEERLNWDAWGRSMNTILQTMGIRAA
jgi:glycosyltransferase involved in cell wall biosynthesis